MPALELILDKTSSRSAPTQMSLENPFKHWIKSQELAIPNLQIEKGTYRLRMMYSNMLHHYGKKRSAPREFVPKFTKIWRLIQQTIPEGPDEDDDEDAVVAVTPPPKRVRATPILISGDTTPRRTDVLHDDDPELNSLLQQDDEKTPLYGESLLAVLTPPQALRIRRRITKKTVPEVSPRFCVLGKLFSEYPSSLIIGVLHICNVSYAHHCSSSCSI